MVAVTLGAALEAAEAFHSSTAGLANIEAAQWCADNQLTGLKPARRYRDIGDSLFTCDELGRSYNGKLIVRTDAEPELPAGRCPRPRRQRHHPAVAVHHPRTLDDAGHSSSGVRTGRGAGLRIVVVMAMMWLVTLGKASAASSGRAIRTRSASSSPSFWSTVMTQWEQDLASLQETTAVPALTCDGQSVRLTRRAEGGMSGVVLLVAAARRHSSAMWQR